MGSVNVVHLVGIVGRDAEVRHTNSGTSVASFSVATNEKYNGKEETTWHNIVAWGKTADVAGEYVKKGMQIYIQGRISNRKYEKDGKSQTISEVVVSSMQFLGSAKSAGGASKPASRGPGDDSGGGSVPF